MKLLSFVLFLLFLNSKAMAAACTGPHWEKTKEKILKIQSAIVCEADPKACSEQMNYSRQDLMAATGATLGASVAAQMSVKKSVSADFCKTSSLFQSLFFETAYASTVCRLNPQKVKSLQQESRANAISAIEQNRLAVHEKQAELQTEYESQKKSLAPLESEKADLLERKRKLDNWISQEEFRVNTKIEQIQKNPNMTSAQKRITINQLQDELDDSKRVHKNKSLGTQNSLQDVENKRLQIQSNLKNTEARRLELSKLNSQISDLHTRAKSGPIDKLDDVLDKTADISAKVLDSIKARANVTRLGQSMAKWSSSITGNMEKAGKKAGLWVSKKLAIAAVATPAVSFASMAADVAELTPVVYEQGRRGANSLIGLACDHREKNLSSWELLTPPPSCNTRLSKDFFLQDDEAYTKNSDLYNEIEKNPQYCEWINKAYASYSPTKWVLSCTGDSFELTPRFGSSRTSISGKVSDSESLVVTNPPFSYDINFLPDDEEAAYEVEKTEHKSGRLKRSLSKYNRIYSSLPDYNSEDPSVREDYKHIHFAQANLLGIEIAKTCCLDSSLPECSSLLKEKVKFKGSRANPSGKQ